MACCIILCLMFVFCSPDFLRGMGEGLGSNKF